MRKLYRVLHKKRFLIYTLVILNNHMCRSKQIWIYYTKTYDSQIKTGTVHSMSTWWNTQVWSKSCLFQQKKVTNLLINHHSLHFKCMKVNIFGKCIIQLPNLQQIMVLYRVCLTYIIVYSKIYVFFTFLIYPGYSKQYVDQNRCEFTRQDCVFK